MRGQVLDEDRLSAVERRDEGMARIVAPERKVHDRAARDAVLRDEQHLGAKPVDHEHRGLAHRYVRDEPVDRTPRRFLHVDTRQQELDEREPGFRVHVRKLRYRRGHACHQSLSLHGPSAAPAAFRRR
jgi:hypothetical protein